LYTARREEGYMTLPDERYRALESTADFLMDLCIAKRTPRVPAAVRLRASSLLRHYPRSFDLDQLAAAAPEVIVARMEDLHRFIAAAVDKDPES
jgi:hypothetical protein